MTTQAAVGPLVERTHHQDERRQALYEILTTLPDNLREAFVLRELQELPAAEVAKQLGTSEGNVAVRASRTRAKIREELARRGWLEETGR